MKQNKRVSGQDPIAKIALVVAMYAGAALITASGALFLVYSFAQNIRINILGLTIPGFAVALLMLFFGVRSFFAVHRFSRAALKNMPRLSPDFIRSRTVKSKPV